MFEGKEGEGSGGGGGGEKEVLKEADRSGIYFFRSGGILAKCENLHFLRKKVKKTKEMEGEEMEEGKEEDEEEEEEEGEQENAGELWRNIESVWRDVLVTKDGRPFILCRKGAAFAIHPLYLPKCLSFSSLSSPSSSSSPSSPDRVVLYKYNEVDVFVLLSSGKIYTWRRKEGFSPQKEAEEKGTKENLPSSTPPTLSSDPATGTPFSFVELLPEKKTKYMDCHARFALVLSTSGELYSWGSSSNGALGNGPNLLQTSLKVSYCSCSCSCVFFAVLLVLLLLLLLGHLMLFPLPLPFI